MVLSTDCVFWLIRMIHILSENGQQHQEIKSTAYQRRHTNNALLSNLYLGLLTMWSYMGKQVKYLVVISKRTFSHQISVGSEKTGTWKTTNGRQQEALSQPDVNVHLIDTIKSDVHFGGCLSWNIVIVHGFKGQNYICNGRRSFSRLYIVPSCVSSFWQPPCDITRDVTHKYFKPGLLWHTVVLIYVGHHKSPGNANIPFTYSLTLKMTIKR